MIFEIYEYPEYIMFTRLIKKISSQLLLPYCDFLMVDSYVKISVEQHQMSASTIPFLISFRFRGSDKKKGTHIGFIFWTLLSYTNNGIVANLPAWARSMMRLSKACEPIRPRLCIIPPIPARPVEFSQVIKVKYRLFTCVGKV